MGQEERSRICCLGFIQNIHAPGQLPMPFKGHNILKTGYNFLLLVYSCFAHRTLTGWQEARLQMKPWPAKESQVMPCLRLPRENPKETLGLNHSIKISLLLPYWKTGWLGNGYALDLCNSFVSKVLIFFTQMPIYCYKLNFKIMTVMSKVCIWLALIFSKRSHIWSSANLWGSCYLYRQEIDIRMYKWFLLRDSKCKFGTEIFISCILPFGFFWLSLSYSILFTEISWQVQWH